MAELGTMCVFVCFVVKLCMIQMSHLNLVCNWRLLWREILTITIMIFSLLFCSDLDRAGKRTVWRRGGYEKTKARRRREQGRQERTEWGRRDQCQKEKALRHLNQALSICLQQKLNIRSHHGLIFFIYLFIYIYILLHMSVYLGL